MIIVLKATNTQKTAIHGYENGISRIEFIKDGNGNWIVGKGVIDNPDFAPILPQLLDLSEIDYVPPKGADDGD
jgi:hypothetical protein